MTVTYRFRGICCLPVALDWVRLRHVHVEVRPRRPGHPFIISSCSLRPSQSHGSCRLAITVENGELFRAAQKCAQIWRNCRESAAGQSSPFSTVLANRHDPWLCEDFREQDDTMKGCSGRHGRACVCIYTLSVPRCAGRWKHPAR